MTSLPIAPAPTTLRARNNHRFTLIFLGELRWRPGVPLCSLHQSLTVLQAQTTMLR